MIPRDRIVAVLVEETERMILARCREIGRPPPIFAPEHQDELRQACGRLVDAALEVLGEEIASLDEAGLRAWSWTAIQPAVRSLLVAPRRSRR